MRLHWSLTEPVFLLGHNYIELLAMRRRNVMNGIGRYIAKSKWERRDYSFDQVGLSWFILITTSPQLTADSPPEGQNILLWPEVELAFQRLRNSCTEGHATGPAVVGKQQSRIWSSGFRDSPIADLGTIFLSVVEDNGVICLCITWKHWHPCCMILQFD